MFTGLGRSGCAQCREAAPGLPAVPTPSVCTDKGTVGSPSKPSGRGHGARFVAGAPEAELGLGIRPSGNTGTPTGCLAPCPHPGCLAGAEEAGWQRELSGAGLMVMPWGWAEAPLSSADRDQEPKAGPLPGPLFLLSDTRFLYVLVKTHTYKKIPSCS